MKRCPRGYSIKIESPNSACGVYFNLLHASERVGYVDLRKTQINVAGHMCVVWETHSSIDEEHRNKGFGIMLYDRAISYSLVKKQTVCSSYSPSVHAKRVWNSKRLNRMYDIHQFNGHRFCVKGIKDVSDQ